MQLLSGFIDTYLRLNATEMRQYEAAVRQLAEPEREDIMEIVTSWMEEGIQQGRQQGRQQGGQEARLSLVTRQLQRRLGPLEASLRAQVEALSLEQLEHLSEALLDFTTVADLEAWLEANRFA